MKGARAVIINVTGGSDLTLFEIDEACNRIRDEVDPNANIIFGSTYNPAMEGVMRVSIVATGIDVAEMKKGGTKGAFGPHIINAVTAQQQQVERRVERAQPQTVEEPAVSAYARGGYHTAPVMPQGVAVARSAAAAATSRPVVGSAYGVSPVTAASVARRMEDPEGDLFEQQELVHNTYEVAVKKPEAASAPVMAPAIREGTHEVASPASKLRGTVYNDAFIPPQAVEVPPESRSRDGIPGYGPQFSGLAASRSVPAEQQPATGYAAPSAQGYVLRPPVPGSSAAPKKRTASFFERFTNTLRHHDHTEENAAPVAADVSAETGLRASQRPLQGSLNIEAPVAARPAEPADDELDIPAFLRRQAN